MPAKAGIHVALMQKPKMDARFRGHDGPNGYGYTKSVAYATLAFVIPIAEHAPRNKLV
jgi:hypothetical protein